VTEYSFKVGGNAVRLSPEQVVKTLRGQRPGLIQTHTVEVGGVAFPVKEALAKATGLDLLDFNTNQARGIFKKLGFKVSRLK
jgi:hypothetical protein